MPMKPHSLKHIALCFSFVFFLSINCSLALNVTIYSTDSLISVGKGCSRKCESEFCSVAPLLRYGKYCGLLYSGCPGETPCDGIDACCMKHDDCVQKKDGGGYLSEECSHKLLDCVSAFKKSGKHAFKGNKCNVNEVIDVISSVMKAAIVAGNYVHSPP